MRQLTSTKSLKLWMDHYDGKEFQVSRVLDHRHTARQRRIGHTNYKAESSDMGAIKMLFRCLNTELITNYPVNNAMPLSMALWGCESWSTTERMRRWISGSSSTEAPERGDYVSADYTKSKSSELKTKWFDIGRIATSRTSTAPFQNGISARAIITVAQMSVNKLVRKLAYDGMDKNTLGSQENRRSTPGTLTLRPPITLFRHVIRLPEWRRLE